MDLFSVELNHVTKSYGGKAAVRDVSLGVKPGELFGLIGPDGAGKTSLFRMLTTLLMPDAGTIMLEGLDVVRDYRRVRDLVGYMPGRFSLYQDLTVEENLSFFATIFGATVRENYHLIRDIYSHLEPFRDRPAGKLSGGMKQKLALSCCLVHKPRVLVLDEPTTGVDAISRREFWEMLKRLKAEGITILVSTAYMDEAAMCDRIALIQEGRIMTVSPPGEVPGLYRGELWAVRSGEMYRLLKDLQQMEGINMAYLFGQYVHVSARPGVLSHHWLKEKLEGLGHSGVEASGIPAGVEDCFIEMMRQP